MGFATVFLGSNFTYFFDVGSPLAMPSLEAYWRAGDLALGAVPSWTDLSGKARHLPQADPTKQPVNTAAQINGKNAVVFDGVDDFFDNTNIVIPQPWEFWLLFKRLSFVSGDFLYELRTTTLSLYSQDFATTTLRTIAGGTFNSTIVAAGAGSPWYLLRVSSAAGTNNTNVVVNNGAVVTTPASGTTTFGIERLILGGKVGGTLNPNIAVAEAFLLNAVSTAAQRTALHNYFNDAYALGLTP